MIGTYKFNNVHKIAKSQVKNTINRVIYKRIQEEIKLKRALY